ncbi:MAG TPA: hypothetical protein V6D29_14985 [Leptolyngbyaceae cyanobacterium]
MSQPPKDSSAAQPFSAHEESKEAALVEHRVNADEMFTLIDGILPFEACLYYQVLPLSIEGSRLNLGMVNPVDQAAAEYVRRQISYINYSVVTWKISSDWHRDSLSRYLSHAAKIKQLRNRTSQAKGEDATDAATPPDPSNYQATLVVDTPEELEDNFQAQRTPVAPSAASESSPSNRSNEREEASTRQATTKLPRVENAPQPLELKVEAKYRFMRPEALRQLSSKSLMEALLSQVLEEGIGRLYFECHADHGRILWSRDGVVQLVLDAVSSETFQGVINEFKRMTHLPMLRMSKAKQVEIERLLQGERVLLRFRVMPTAEGEEATLQVLRGTALKFYQQQQIEKLGRDALGIAQNLQQRLSEIRDRGRQTLNFSITQQETLPAIIRMLRQMEAQIQEMMQATSSEADGQEGEEN